ncbi:MAG: PKD domain-containing protein, partial [Chitinophagaceae bacterium]
MRKICLPSTLVLVMLFCGTLHAQDFSNRGKEFWLAYSFHVGMVNQGGNPAMTLYITSDVTTTYTVEIFGATTITTGTINAGQVATVNIPTAYFIKSEGLFNNKAIRVTAEKPVVVYSYITRSAASGATLCLPTTVLGREYISMNYTQVSNEDSSHSFITIVAIEDNTNVQITPSANTKNGWLANNAYTVALNKGDIYQVLGTVNGRTGADLTGTTVKSVASGVGGCKRIAVFSGSGKISIGCGSVGGSSDNLYQQLYPIASWGKKYLTAPSFGRPNAIYRVARSVPGSNVFVNGVLVPAISFINNVYEFSNTTPNRIESDQPICVAQYFSTQGCFNNASPYDPDMIILNPVEQNIDRVTLVSSNLVATQNRQHHLQVIMKNGGTALTSFRLDGALIPSGSWSQHPADPGYSYIYLSNVSQGYHTLSCDTGFNALAYGYADAETYGYSAGSNIKDLYQFVSVNNLYATVNFPAACRNSPYSLSMTFPYQPTQIIWQFNGLFPDTTINTPVFDEMVVLNGRTLYKYNLNKSFITVATGTYPIRIVAQNPTADGCSGLQEIDYDLQVFDPPIADFKFATDGCVSSPVAFTDASINSSGRAVIHRYWDLDDGNTQNNVTTITHQYAAARTYNVKYTLITDVGCKADTTFHDVVLNEMPVANFTTAVPYCMGRSITFNQASTAGAGSAVAKWIWNFGDGTPVTTVFTNANQVHIYAASGPYKVTLQVESDKGCLSTVTSRDILVTPVPEAKFTPPDICVSDLIAPFKDESAITGGTITSWQWDFGDANSTAFNDNISVAQNSTHHYILPGDYTVQLITTSDAGCKDTAEHKFTVNGAVLTPAFNLQNAVQNGGAICSNEKITIKDASKVD